MRKSKFQMLPAFVMVIMMAMVCVLSACEKENEEPDYAAFNTEQKDLNTEFYSNSSEPDYFSGKDIIYYSTDITYKPLSDITGGPVAVFAYDTESLPTLYTCSYQLQPYQISALGTTLTITDVSNIHLAKMMVIRHHTDKEEIKEYDEDLKIEGVRFSKTETVNGNFNKDSEYITLDQNGGDVEGFGKIEKTANNQIRLTVDRNTVAEDCYFKIYLSYSKEVQFPNMNCDKPFIPKFSLYFKRLGLKTE